MSYELTPKLGLRKPDPGTGERWSTQVYNENLDLVDAASGVADWDDVQNRPASFPPAAHTHAAADVTSGTLDVDRVPDVPVAKVLDSGATGRALVQAATPTAGLAAVRVFVGEENWPAEGSRLEGDFLVRVRS